MTDPNGICSWWSTRCWEYWTLVGVAEGVAIGIAGFASAFCDDITWGVCGFLDNAIFRAFAGAVWAVMQAWWFRWCHGTICYLWTFLSAFIYSLIYSMPGWFFRRYPALLDRLQDAVYYRVWGLMYRLFK